MAVSGQPASGSVSAHKRLYREDLAVSGQQNNLDRVVVFDYTERIWRYQDNRKVEPSTLRLDYTERIWRYQDNSALAARILRLDYTERIWRYQDNCRMRSLCLRADYTERIWRYQDNSMTWSWRSTGGLYREDLAVSGQLIEITFEPFE